MSDDPDKGWADVVPRHTPQAPPPAPSPLPRHEYDTPLPEARQFSESDYKRRKAQRRLHAEPVSGLRWVSGGIDLFFWFIGMIFWVAIADSFTLAGNEAEDAVGWAVLIYLPVTWLISMVMECSRYQGTLGKILTGTVITDRQGQRISFFRAFGRGIGKGISYALPLFIGYLTVPFMQKHQAVHDMIAGTLVFKKSDAPFTDVGSVFD